ncbi:hypothetical protein [Flavivirga spongiicola]|uniref:Uncharacterized protein n=1 Tax=Flavivirga spongiicola TaxID=421621 RepID=A0ABU7XVR1_9FLAO|nr:hypothetical protein [Flavivirga sp. MEBiC05379]MDO5979870.1 hypothetical protein [Flavivirga sp. MEBiC05379]
MPFAESMISTLKSNKSIMLDKSRRFRKTLGGLDWSKSQQFNFPKATPEQLKEIKERLREENRKDRLKQMLLFVILFSILLLMLFYLTD